MVRSIVRLYKMILGLVELFFAIPIFGGGFIIAHAYTPLVVLIVLHAVGVALANGARKTKGIHIFGVVGNMVAFIPIVGWLVHLLVGLGLLISGFNDKTV